MTFCARKSPLVQAEVVMSPNPCESRPATKPRQACAIQADILLEPAWETEDGHAKCGKSHLEAGPATRDLCCERLPEIVGPASHRGNWRAATSG